VVSCETWKGGRSGDDRGSDGIVGIFKRKHGLPVLVLWIIRLVSC